MFNETKDGETQYCPLCEEWARKYEALKEDYTALSQTYDACEREYKQVLSFAEMNRLADQYGVVQIEALETENEKLRAENSTLNNRYRELLEKYSELKEAQNAEN